MRIYISLDAEGATGLCDFSEVEPQSPLYHRGVTAMERDLRAVLEGAREGGATEFYVCDAHEMGRNLSLDHLGEDVIVVRGTGHALSMMARVDRAEFDGAFFVAYHGKNGSQGVMAHTYYPGVVERVLVAGHEVGELGMNIPVAWAFGIPALLATGDDVLLEEARKVAPRIERCLVKEALGPGCALCYDGQRTAHDLRVSAKRAVLNLRSARDPIAVAGDLEVVFHTPRQAQAAAAYGELQEGNRVSFQGDDYLAAFKKAVRAMGAAAEVEIG